MTLMSGALNDLTKNTLLVVGALFPIVDPIGSTPIFLSLTRGLSEHGQTRHFDAREPQIEDVVYRAWFEQSVVSVFAEEHDHHRPLKLILRRPH